MNVNRKYVASSLLSFTMLAMGNNGREFAAQERHGLENVAAEPVRVCPDEFLTSPPKGVHPIGPGVSAPKPKYAPPATLSDEFLTYLKEQQVTEFEAVSIVGLTVDVMGKPRDVCVLKKAGYGLDGKALKQVTKYRFEPAILDGNPVPVRVAVEVRFAAD